MVSKPEFLQRERGVDAAVVELDALPDAVRPAAEDDDFLFPALAPLIFVAVGGVVIRRVGLELRRAGVHEAVGGDDAVCRSALLAPVVNVSRRSMSMASCRSEKPSFFALTAHRSLRPKSVSSAARSSTPRMCSSEAIQPLASSTICRMFSRNHRSIFVSSKIPPPSTRAGTRARGKRSAPRSAPSASSAACRHPRPRPCHPRSTQTA